MRSDGDLGRAMSKEGQRERMSKPARQDDKDGFGIKIRETSTKGIIYQ